MKTFSIIYFHIFNIIFSKSGFLPVSESGNCRKQLLKAAGADARDRKKHHCAWYFRNARKVVSKKVFPFNPVTLYLHGGKK
jgi:hypothetical protein